MIRILCALATLLCPLGATAQTGGSLSEITPRAIDLPQVLLPSHDRMQSRQMVQLAWNAETATLERVILQVSDPLASEQLELSWKTDATVLESGLLTGSGRLSWRQPGMRPYDPLAEVAYFDGQLKEGAFTGTGRYWHRSGTVYEGQWDGGVMDGTGHLQLGDGRSYRGGFQAGLFHGAGQLHARSGDMLEGRFEQGVLDGPARLTQPDGTRFATFWQRGVEELSRRAPLDEKAFEPRLAQGQVHADVSLLVSVDRRLPPLQRGGRGSYIEYQARLENGALVVFPESDDFMAQWRGGAALREVKFGFYDYFIPANFLMSFENRGVQAVEVVGGYLNVQASQQDLDPFTTYGTPLDCGELTLTEVYLRNWGRGQPQNVSVKGGLISRDGTQIVMPLNISSLQGWPRVTHDFAQALAQNDPVLAGMAQQPVSCSTSNQAECLEVGKAQGVFGKAGPSLYLGLNGAIRADYYGVLSYDWTDRLGQTQRKQSLLRAPVEVGSLVAASECGEGSDFDSPVRAARGSRRLPLSVPAFWHGQPGHYRKLELPDRRAEVFAPLV